MRFLLLAIAMLLAPITARAEDVRIERIDVVDTGIYTVVTGEETTDPNAPTGTICRRDHGHQRRDDDRRSPASSGWSSASAT